MRIAKVCITSNYCFTSYSFLCTCGYQSSELIAEEQDWSENGFGCFPFLDDDDDSSETGSRKKRQITNKHTRIFFWGGGGEAIM